MTPSYTVEELQRVEEDARNVNLERVDIEHWLAVAASLAHELREVILYWERR